MLTAAVLTFTNRKAVRSPCWKYPWLPIGVRLVMMTGSSLFLSYNSRDREQVRRVQRLLAARGIDTFFDEQNLRVGQNWAQALEKALTEANAVAVFVGREIGSWQWPEIGFALDRQARDPQFPVIPVLLDGADVTRSFLFLNTWVDLRGDRLDEPRALGKLIEALAGGGARPTDPPELNPYRGLEFFDEAHAPFFFGREAVIEQLTDRLTRQRKRFLAVIGASGSGKSSVVRAGLGPALRRRRPPHETWDIAAFTPGERPWFRLADALAPLRFPDRSDSELDIEVEKLARALQSGELTVATLLDRILRRQGNLHRLLLGVDQFEELFTLTPAAERSAFIAALLGALSVEGVVLLPALRADFYGQAIESNRRLSELLSQEQVTLGRLSAEELSRAIIEPARLVDLQFDPGLPELLLRDAGNEPGNLPLLQHALLELYERRTNRRLTTDAYMAIGGIRGAIANSAEREFQRFEEQGQGPLLRSVFTQLVRLARADEGLEDTRRRIAISALPPEAGTMIDELSSYQMRLLVKTSERTVAPGSAEADEEKVATTHETVEVAHEALIREWARLRQWLNEDRSFYLWRQRLDQAIQDFDQARGGFLTGPALKEAEGRLAAATPEPLTPRQRAFVEASVGERDRSEREERRREEQHRREKEELQARERRALEQAAQHEREARVNAEHSTQSERDARRNAERAKRISSFAVAILVVTTAITGTEYLRAERQRRASTAQTLVTSANVLDAEKQVTKAALLTVLSLQIMPTAHAQDLAVDLLGRTEIRSRPLLGHTDVVWALAISPDGSRIISGGSDRTLRLWDAASGKARGAPLSGHEDVITSVAFSPDGARIASGSRDQTVRLWDVKSGRAIGKPLRGHEGFVTSVAFSRDGLRLVSGGADVTVRLWDATRGEPIGTALRGHEDGVNCVAFNPDATRVVSGSRDKTLRLWNAQTGLPIGQPLRGHEDWVGSVAFSPDGTRIVSSSADRTLRIWNAQGGQPIGVPLTGHENAVTSAAFDPSGTLIVSGSSDATLRLWDAKTGHALGEPLRGHEAAIWSVAFTPDSTRLASASTDTTLRLWEAAEKSGTAIKKTLRGDADTVTSVAFSPDSSRVVSGSEDRMLRIWDAKIGQLIRKVPGGHEDEIRSVAFSPDGLRIVSGSRDKTLRLWDAKSGEPIGDALRGHDNTVMSVRFSPDGRRIASGSADRTLRLWDAASGQPVGEPLRGHRGVISSVAFSPDGSRLVSGSGDMTLRLWDAKSGQPVGAPLRGHTGWVTSVAFSPNGARIVSSSADKTLRLWDARSGRPIGQPLRGHEDIVWSVAFNPAGTRIASASEDTTVRMWNAQSGQPIGAGLRGHQSWVLSVAFSPDGTRIVSASSDHTLRLWNAALIDSPDALSFALCNSLNRNLSREEWVQFVPGGEKFRAVCDALPLR